MWNRGDVFRFKCGWGVCVYLFSPTYKPRWPRRDRVKPCTENMDSHQCTVIMLDSFEDSSPGDLDNLYNTRKWSILSNGRPATFSMDLSNIEHRIENGVMKRL